MRHRVSIALALALSALSPNAFGDPDPAVTEPATDLTPPELPAAPPEFQAAVDALRQTVSDTAECYTAGGRMEHEPDARCPQWYARIARAGAAGAFAIGELFRPAPNDNSDHPMEPLRSSEGDFERGPRLVQLLVATRRPEAAAYLVSYLVRTATSPDAYPGGTDAAALQGLRTLTGDDPAPTAPWEDDAAHLESPIAREEVARRWNRWLRDHAGMTVAQWRAEGARNAQRWLSSDDILERYSAIRRLAAVPAQRAAVTASLHALLAREDLPARARVHLARLARQRGLAMPVRANVVAAR